MHLTRATVHAAITFVHACPALLTSGSLATLTAPAGGRLSSAARPLAGPPPCAGPLRRGRLRRRLPSPAACPTGRCAAAPRCAPAAPHFLCGCARPPRATPAGAGRGACGRGRAQRGRRRVAHRGAARARADAPRGEGSSGTGQHEHLRSVGGWAGGGRGGNPQGTRGARGPAVTAHGTTVGLRNSGFGEARARLGGASEPSTGAKPGWQVPLPQDLVARLQPIPELELAHGMVREQGPVDDEIMPRQEEQVHLGGGGDVREHMPRHLLVLREHRLVPEDISGHEGVGVDAPRHRPSDTIAVGGGRLAADPPGRLAAAAARSRLARELDVSMGGTPARLQNVKARRDLALPNHRLVAGVGTGLEHRRQRERLLPRQRVRQPHRGQEAHPGVQGAKRVQQISRRALRLILRRHGVDYTGLVHPEEQAPL
eukprot:scaffold9860_cov92-Isochrysis_galbana.AAC.1